MLIYLFDINLYFTLAMFLFPFFFNLFASLFRIIFYCDPIWICSAGGNIVKEVVFVRICKYSRNSFQHPNKWCQTKRIVVLDMNNINNSRGRRGII